MKPLDVFSSIKTDLSSVGLIRDASFPHYFCTPLDALIFANLGVDGIHFCVIPDEHDLTLESSTVYIVSPMMADNYVEAVANNFYDFMSLVASTKYAGLLECISYLDGEGFLRELQSVPQNDPEAESALEAISNAFPIKIIDDVYAYVRDIQKKTDLTKIRHTPEYYELTGRIV